MVSDRGSSADETDLASHPSKDTHGSDVAAASFTTRRVNPTKECPRDFCAIDVKIAPIFLRTTKHNNNGRMGQREMAFPSQIEKVQQVKSQTERKDHCRGQLPVPGLLSFLEEIQTSNPAFPARTVFSNLQKKTSEQDSGDALLLSLCIDILASCIDINDVRWFVCVCSAQHVQTVFVIQSRKLPGIKFPKEPLKREEETEEWEL